MSTQQEAPEPAEGTPSGDTPAQDTAARDTAVGEAVAGETRAEAAASDAETAASDAETAASDAEAAAGEAPVTAGEAVAQDAAAGDTAAEDSRRGPVHRVTGLVGRHKVISSAVTLFAVAVITVSALTAAKSPVKSYPAAPGFTIAELGHPGTKLSLSEFKGKPVVLNFWASWCEICKSETPLLASWYKQQHGHVIMIGLDENDGASSAMNYVHAKGMTYPIAFDPTMIAAGSYGVAGLPQTYFLNSKHHIVDHLIGKVTKAEMNNGLRLMNTS